MREEACCTWCGGFFNEIKSKGKQDYMKIFVWGTGRITGNVVGRWIDLGNVLGFIDNNPNIEEYLGKIVIQPDKIKNYDYDAIVVANMYTNEIMEQCKKLDGVDMDKIIYLYNNCKITDCNKNYDFIKEILGKEYAQIIKERYRLIRRPTAYGDLCFDDTRFDGTDYIDTDYVRMKTLELVVKELRKKKISGSVAEAGVFRGEFAQYINHAFPNRKLYLFDTFDGFDAQEALREIKLGNCSDSFIEAYKNTNIKTVLDKMENLKMIEIRQGFFPETAENLEDVYAFVSLDMDFEESIYQGLVYFYPRLSKGGYIFIHDYNSDLRGVERAVDRYESDFNISLCKVPICDASGTLIICKQV